MIPSKVTLSKLKAEIYTNAVRLFIDACTLYKKRSYASSFALAILSFEELGKLEMVDHICDDISINPDSNPQDFLNHLFSRPMFFNHKISRHGQLTQYSILGRSDSKIFQKVCLNNQNRLPYTLDTSIAVSAAHGRLPR